MPIDKNLNKGLAFLMSQKGDKGVSENPLSRGGKVRKDNAGSDLKKLLEVQGVLKTNEVARYTKIAQIFKSVLAPKEEANVLTSAEKKVKDSLPVKAPQIKAESQTDKKGWLASLMSMLGLGFLNKDMILKFLKDRLGAFMKWLSPKLKGAVSWLGRKIWRGIKRVGIGLWNVLKGVGKRLGSLFAGLWKNMKGTKAYTAFTDGIQKGVDSLKAFVSNAKQFLIDKIKAVGSFFKNAISKIPGIEKLFPNIAKSASTAAATKAAGTAATKAAGTAATKAAGAAKPAKAARAAKQPGFFGRALSWGKSQASRAGKAVATAAKVTGKTVATAAKATGRGVVSAGKWVGERATSLKDKAIKPLLDKATTAFKELLKGGGNFLGKTLGTTAKQVAKRVPIIGSLIEGLFLKGTLKDLQNKMMAGEITEEEYKKLAGGEFMKSIGGVAGAGIGAAIGSFIPIPVLGTLAGAVGGDLLGRFVMSLLNEYVFSDNYKSKAGEWILGLMMQSPQGQIKLAKNELQDFLVHKGTVTSFSNKDDVLGMKAGGAIDNLINQRSVESKKLNQQLVTLAAEQLQLLREIAFNTKASAGSRGTTVIQGAGNQQSAPQQDTLRPAFMDVYRSA